MAEGFLRHLMEQKGRRDMQIMSAGTGALPGMGPTLETVQVMWEQGVDVSGHLSQQLTPDLIYHADAIFCMEDFHRDEVLAMEPEAEGKTNLLRVFGVADPGPDAGVPDPIGQPIGVYQICARTIVEAVKRVADWIEKP